MSIFDSEKLLVDLKKGNEEAFTSIFRNYFPRLCEFAKTYVVDESTAQNIVQDVFLKLWEIKKDICNSKSILAYLLTITKNSCLDYLKHQQVVLKHEKEAVSEFKEINLNYHSLKRLEIDLLDYNEIMQIVEETLEKLPPRCQQVFKLSRFEAKTNAEIADELEIGIKAVEANMTRALKIFRKELKDYITILILLNIPFN